MKGPGGVSSAFPVILTVAKSLNLVELKSWPCRQGGAGFWVDYVQLTLTASRNACAGSVRADPHMQIFE